LFSKAFERVGDDAIPSVGILKAKLYGRSSNLAQAHIKLSLWGMGIVGFTNSILLANQLISSFNSQFSTCSVS